MSTRVEHPINLWEPNYVEGTWKTLRSIDTKKILTAQQREDCQTILMQLGNFLAPLQEIMRAPLLQHWELYAYMQILSSVDAHLTASRQFKACMAMAYGEILENNKEWDEDQLPDLALDAKNITFRINTAFFKQNNLGEKLLNPESENEAMTFLRECATKFKAEKQLESGHKGICTTLFKRVQTSIEPVRSFVECTVFKEDEFYTKAFTIITMLESPELVHLEVEAKLSMLYRAVYGRATGGSNVSSKHSTPGGTPSKPEGSRDKTLHSPGPVLSAVAGRLASMPSYPADVPPPASDSKENPPAPNSATPLLKPPSKPKNNDCCTLI